MHCFGIFNYSVNDTMILTEYFWEFKAKLHCGNVVNMPYSTITTHFSRAEHVTLRLSQKIHGSIPINFSFPIICQL